MNCKSLVALAAICFSTIASAGEVTGTISSLRVRQTDGLVYFYMNGTPTGKPSCATANYWMIKDENSEAGKQLYAMLMAAHLAGRQIKVTGNNACTRWVNGEDVKMIELLP